MVHAAQRSAVFSPTPFVGCAAHPLLLPQQQLQSALAHELYLEATDQQPGDKFSQLRQALRVGSVDAGRVLINFARPNEVQSASHTNKINYWQYMVATALLNDANAQDELCKHIRNHCRLHDLQHIQQLVMPYRDRGYEINSIIQLITKRKMQLGGSIGEFHSHALDEQSQMSLSLA